MKKKASQKAPSEMPDAIKAQMGHLTRDDLETMLKNVSNGDEDYDELDEMARNLPGIAKQAKEEDFDEEDEDGLMEDDDWAEDEEDGHVFVEEESGPRPESFRTSDRQRKRSPPPYAPGRVMLDVNDWKNETKDPLVEYIRKGEEGARETVIGIVRRPRGLRHWGIVNVENGSEERVNVYKIIWQWPHIDGKTAQFTQEDALLAKHRANELYNSITMHPVELWKFFVLKLKPQRKKTVVTPKLENQYEFSVRSVPGFIPKPTLRRKQYNAQQEVIEVKPDSATYIDIELAAEKLFGLDRASLTSEHLYATHKFMHNNDIYFVNSAHRGFECRDMNTVHGKLIQRTMQHEDDSRRDAFVNKLRLILQEFKALETLKSETPVLLQGSNFVLDRNFPGALASPDITFNAEELEWIRRLKAFALSGEEAEDFELAHKVLEPLGFGDRPHHAFELLSQFGIISRYDNPHLLRYQGPLGFEPKQEKLAREIVEFIDGEEELLLDFDAKQRIDFSAHPSFAIDAPNAEEIDDVISLVMDEQHREWIYIHVTDVHRYILPNSILDMQARARSVSLYLPDQSYGIFPDIIRHHLSIGNPNQAPVHGENSDLISKAEFDRLESPSSRHPEDNMSEAKSLSEKVKGAAAEREAKARKQPVLSFGALLDAGGKIEEWQVVNGWISNVERVTYDQLNEIILSRVEGGLTKLKEMKQGDSTNSGPKSRHAKYLLSSLGQNDSKTASTSLATLSDEAGASLEDRLGVNLTAAISDRAAELRRNYQQLFIRMMDFATKRRAYRLDRRAILSYIPKPELKVTVDETGRAQASVKMSEDYNKNAQGLVTEFMLLAGEIAGKFCAANTLPAYYLTQDTRKQEYERSLVDLAQMASILSLNPKSTAPEIIRNLNNWKSLRPAIVTTQPTENIAQGLPLYVNVTSPLRRYFDLVAHYQIKAALRRRKAPFTLQDLHLMGTPLQTKRTEVTALANHSSKFWVLQCLQQIHLTDPYRKFKALVIDSGDIKTTSESTVLLLDFGIQSNITAKRLLLKGETISVRVDMINPFYDTLILKEVRTTPAKRRKP